MPLAVVTGLKREAHLARKAGLNGQLVVAAGPGAPIAADIIAGLKDRGASGIISFGVAGGLTATLQPGTLLLPERITGPEDEAATPVDAVLHQRLIDALGGSHEVDTRPLLCSSNAITTPEEKLRAGKAADACAVDMESLPVLQAAASQGLPFAAIKALADPADRAIPDAVVRAVRPDGEISVTALVYGLLTGQVSLSQIKALKDDNGLAESTLKRAVKAALPLFMPEF